MPNPSAYLQPTIPNPDSAGLSPMPLAYYSSWMTLDVGDYGKWKTRSARHQTKRLPAVGEPLNPFSRDDSRGRSKESMTVSKQTVLMIGADRGIGHAMATLLSNRGDHVIAACLGATRFENGYVEVHHPFDVASDDDVARLSRSLSQRTIDTLMYIPGIVIDSPLGRFDFDAMHKEYEINAIGFLRVAQATLPMMVDGGRVGIITSRVASLSENQSGGLYGYRMSKAAANMAALCLARELEKKRIAVVCLHPGTVRTRLTSSLGGSPVMGSLVEPEHAAKGLVERLDELDISTTGTFRHANGQTLPW
ncbi:MAG: SDR family oxidoreductase [Panacagrimonas sp.]